jgi:hypothetical protein
MGAIQETVSKFCGYITQIDGRDQSGLTIHDRVCFIISYHIKIQCFYHNYVSSHIHDNCVQVEQAENMFKRFERKTFLFRHSWIQLKDQPKWREKLQQIAAQKAMNKKPKSAKDSSPGSFNPINVDAINQETNGDVPPANIIGEADAPTRSMGKKKAKELAHRGGSEACVEALDIFCGQRRKKLMQKRS